MCGLWHEQAMGIWLLGFWLHMLHVSGVWQEVVNEERWRGPEHGKKTFENSGKQKVLEQRKDGQFLSVF